ncbi:hypothetical protein AAFC00_003990 [Neodothiora populina]|uniref:RING-type domain-containing protein n=1 Tax=Neodothiora populina TaxID=2781224 RepID=A0ABR3PI93_9PEZI
MTDTCIVCLGDLRVATPDGVVKVEERSPSLTHDDEVAAAAAAPEYNNNDETTINSTNHSNNRHHNNHHQNHHNHIQAANQSKQAEDDEIIAHLLPCGHNLHDSCLRPWVERANSCPICRAQFNVVELRKALDTPSFSSYAVQDKQQQAELDPTLVVDEDLFEVDEPCIVCGSVSSQYEVMYCDGCDRTVHVFCAGFNESPEVWYCEACVKDMDSATNPTRRNITRRATGHVASSSRRGRGRRHRVSEWDRVWQQVWARLDLDLDFPFDEEAPQPRRTLAERLELEAWQERLRVANRQGGTNRFRDTASTLLHRHQQQPPPPESQEEIRAWNAFDKVMHMANDERSPSGRKRKSATTSPASPRDSDAVPERKLKRPRTRRNVIVGPEPGPSTSRPSHQPAVEQPSFLTSLLQEVEKLPAPSDNESPAADQSDEEQQHSPYVLSPGSSPLQSGQVSPRANSVTPPPQDRPRPASPTPLTSIVRPRPSNISPPFSPYSPAASSPADRAKSRVRSPTRPSSPATVTSPSSPSRMSYSTKTEIQRMVKATLGPRYRQQQITKDQYTDINRDVSRLMYEKVGDAEALADQDGRDKWQRFANEEVDKAIEAIRADEQHGQGVPVVTA